MDQINITYSELLQLPDLNQYKPDEVIGLLGNIFEEHRQRQNCDDIKTGINFGKKQDLKHFSNRQKMLFYYNLANGWSYLKNISQQNNTHAFSFYSQELEEEIINRRLALKYSENVDDNFNKCQILTNLGNLFSHIGRYSEAHTYWRQALRIDKNFGMAIGNVGYNLVYYANTLYDSGHKKLFYQKAYKNLTDSLENIPYADGREAFLQKALELEKDFGKINLTKIQDLTNFSLGHSNAEKAYRKWCLQNHLFLNPLNDIFTENIAAHDCLLLPNMILELNKPPIYQTIFNQIKQEFVSARYLLYEGINLRELHFSDRDNLQMSTLDYATYSYSSEKIKIAFRTVYSIFDKIGQLLNSYLDIGILPNQVDFRHIWHEYIKRKPVGIKGQIAQTENWAFRGLYWLSKDLYKNNLSSIEPDAEELATIRNYIEHKSFKIVEYGEIKIVDDELTYTIQINDFEKKTLQLLQLVRASMIYLSLGIKIEEDKKANNIGAERKLIYKAPFWKINDELKF